MQTLWWSMLAVATASLIYNVVKELEHRRRGVALPSYLAGGVASALSMISLIASNLLGVEGPIALAALAGTFVFLGLAIVQSVRASRRET